jgi:hypothetical protein
MATLYVFGISISGKDSHFSETNNCPASLSPADSCTIQVATDDSAGVPSGSYSDNVIALVNTVSNAQAAVPISAYLAWKKVD